MYPCPCCGYDVFDEPPGSFAICPICFWEDDIVQLAFPDMEGGANKCSLMNGQENFAAFGACEMRIKPHVRQPCPSDERAKGWRPLDPMRDRFLRWSCSEDHSLWQSVKDSGWFCLYYWLPEYWLTQKSISLPRRAVTYLHIGGVVAVGFDSTGQYLLVVTHSGRGVFSTQDWQRVARNTELAYPEKGIAIGIGPIDGQRIPITEMNYDTGEMRVVSQDGRTVLDCESSGIAVSISDE